MKPLGTIAVLRKALRLRPKRLVELYCVVVGHASSGICERCGRRAR